MPDSKFGDEGNFSKQHHHHHHHQQDLALSSLAERALFGQASFDKGIMSQASLERGMFLQSVGRAQQQAAEYSFYHQDHDVPKGAMDLHVVSQAAAGHLASQPGIERYIAVPINATDHFLISAGNQPFPSPTPPMLEAAGERLPPVGAAAASLCDSADTYLTLVPSEQGSAEATPNKTVSRKSLDTIEQETQY